MNNIEQFHFQNSELIQGLCEGLTGILNNIESGKSVAETDRITLLGLLDSYIDALKQSQNLDVSAIKKVRQLEGLPFEEKTVISELSGLKHSVDVLLKLGREKMVDVSDICFESVAGKVLINKGYCEEVITEKTGRHYYVLSQKGNKCLNNKKVVSQFKMDTSIASFPASISFETEKWSNVYGQRMDLLSYYFKRYRHSAEFIAFTLDENRKLAFGCELSDSLDVKYVFPCIFDDIDERNDIEQIKGLAGSGLIDEILLLVESTEQQERLIASDILNPQKISQLSYFVMN